MTGILAIVSPKEGLYPLMRTRDMDMGIENTQLRDNDIDTYFEAPGLRKCVEE
jgi:hypothetical protein